MPTKVPDPLLSLTVSTTLREKPVNVTPPRKALETLIDAAGGLASPMDPNSPGGIGEDDESKMDLTGMEEVNLFEGLTIGRVRIAYHVQHFNKIIYRKHLR